MTEDEFLELDGPKDDLDKIHVTDLINREPRILVYGYTCERNTFILELTQDGKFQRTIKNPYKGIYLSGPPDEFACHDRCVPDKRVYPAKSDYEFCKLLKNRGVQVYYTGFYP